MKRGHIHGVFFCLALFNNGKVVSAQNHFLRRNSYRLAVLGGQNVVDGEHKGSGFGLCFYGQRQMACHLVAIEVGVVAWAYQRVQTMQGRCTVQEYRMFLDYISKDIPYFRSQLIYLLACHLEVGSHASGNQFMHDERFEEFDSHFLWQAALVHLQFWSDYNYGTAGVVHTLTKKVLTETALLTFQHVGEGLERAVARSGYRSSAAAVIDNGIHSFLEHTLFISYDDFRSTQFEKSLQTVISVDNTAIEIVQVGGSETAAIELNHWTQFRRNNRQHGENHPFRSVLGLDERFYFFQTTDAANLTLTASGSDVFLKCRFHLVKIQFFQQGLDGFCPHACLEGTFTIFLNRLLIFLFIHNLLFYQLGFAWIQYDVRCKVEYTFQLAWRNIEDQSDTGWNSLKVPDMGYRACQLNMPHTFTTYFGAGYFDAALVADGASVTHFLIFSAFAFPVFGRSENLFTEKTILLRFEGSVVNGFRFCYFTMGPFQNLLRGGDADLHGIKFIYI